MFKKVVLTIVLILFIFLLNFRILVYNTNFYFNEFDKIHISVPKEVAQENTNSLISYFKGEKDLTTNFFNEKEKLHLVDVKSLINKTILLFYITILLLLIFIPLNYKDLGVPFIISGISSILIILNFYIIDFQSFFNNTFHKMLFSNNLYILDPAKDNLINLFPYQFFQDLAFKLFFNIFILGLVFILIGLFLKRKQLLNIIKIKSK